MMMKKKVVVVVVMAAAAAVVPTGGGVVGTVLVITVCHCSYVFIDVCFRTSHCFTKFTAGLSGLVVSLLGIY